MICLNKRGCKTGGDSLRPIRAHHAGSRRHGWILISEENKVIVRNFDRDSN